MKLLSFGLGGDDTLGVNNFLQHVTDTTHFITHRVQITIRLKLHSRNNGDWYSDS
jgi:hypothetical protein